MKILIQNGDYTFTAAAGTIAFDNYVSIDIENVLLVTNVVDGIIIYNFADPSKGGTVAGNVLTLNYSTVAMTDTDELQIWYWDVTATQLITTASLPLPTGAATSANQATEIVSLQVLDDAIVVEDAALPSNPSGQLQMGRKRELLTSENVNEGDAIALNSTERGEILSAISDLNHILSRNLSILGELGGAILPPPYRLSVDLTNSGALSSITSVTTVNSITLLSDQTSTGGLSAQLLVSNGIETIAQLQVNRILNY